jgi:hypothetical protein
MSETVSSGDVTIAEDVVRLRNLAASNLAKARRDLVTACNDLAAWELHCWKRLPIGYGIKTDDPMSWQLVKVPRP